MIFLTLALATLQPVIAASSPEERKDFSSRGVFVFGDILLDFQYRTERLGPLKSELTDCSDADYWCAKGGIVRVVVPKSCEPLRVGDSWSHAGITTRVVGMVAAYPEPRHHGPYVTDTYYLSTAGAPELVYKYTGAGIGAIYHDLSKRTDLAALARTGRFVEILRKEAAKSAGERKLFFTHGLITLDPFARCIYK